MTTFTDAETSVSNSRPIDLYTITTPTVTYWLTSYTSDVTYAGNVYTATPGCGRGTINLSDEGSGSGSGTENVLYLPISHPIVRMYAAFGIPEQQILVTLMRYQLAAATAEQEFTGFGQAISINDNGTAQIRVPSWTNDALRIQLPVVAAQRNCNHRLFDARCSPNPGVDGPDPAAYRYTGPCSVAADGVTITVTGLLDTGPAQRTTTWAIYGRVQINGESRRVLSQLGDVVTIDVPFVNSASATALVEAGCYHSMSECKFKFNNRINFGGYPQMNSTLNPWLPSGLGIVQQA